MATSGSTTFNLDFQELLEEAGERCSYEIRSGNDVRTGRRSMNLLLADWANRGVNLWTIDEQSIPLAAGTDTYTLPGDTVDVMDAVIRTGSGVTQADLTISRISASTYATIPSKTNTGRPIQMWVQRYATPQVTFWPVPDDSVEYNFVYWRLRRLQDAGNGPNTQDVPFRFLPCLAAGLAHYLSLKLPGVSLERIAMLKAEYNEAWQIAADEDREKASVRLVPRSG